MAVGIIAGWLGIAGICWWMFEESWLNDFGDVTTSDRAFFIFLALFGPLAFPVALGSYVSSRVQKREPRIIRRREK
jgi:hypothetical protein